MPSVFISYRREDTEGQARALFQELVARLGRDAVFMDVDSIALGQDFREVLQERLATCDLMLVLIGRDWLDGKDESGRRLENAGDFVRLEIAAALKRHIPVTPLLLHGAQMPSAGQLPEDLSDLAYRNGFELSHNRWESDVQELFKRLDLAKGHAAPADKKTDSSSAKRAWFAIAGVFVAALALAVGGFLFYEKIVQEKNYRHKPGSQAYTHYFDSADAQLTIGNAGHFTSSPFTIDTLDVNQDFTVSFQIKSIRNGGSTRYGIAWNYSPDDFMLFTLHSISAGYYSIGPGRSRSYPPFSRVSEGNVSINGENDFDTLQMARRGNTQVFSINGKEVWRTGGYPLISNQFAFWVADFSDAQIKSYTVQQ